MRCMTYTGSILRRNEREATVKMFEELRKKAYEANIALYRSGLVSFDSENVSVIDNERAHIALKPANISFEELTEQDMLVYDIDGNIIFGTDNPLPDAITQLELYRCFESINSIAHTYSLYATSFAQAGRSIKPYGASHAILFPVAVPCTRKMTHTEVTQDFEKSLASIIISTIESLGADKLRAVLVHSQSVFAWGNDPMEAVRTAVALERIAQMAFNTELLQVTIGQNGGVPMPQDLIARLRDRANN